MKDTVAMLLLLCVVNACFLALLYYYVEPSRPSIPKHERDRKKDKTELEERALGKSTEHENLATVHRVNPKERIKYLLEVFSGHEDIPLLESMLFKPRNKKLGSSSTLCPATPPALEGSLRTVAAGISPSWDIIQLQNFMVKKGSFTQTLCEARHRVAVIIPLDGEVELLKALLYHLHPLLRRQQLDYTIYTVSDAGKEARNRAKLLNAGFAEAYNDGPFDCYIFHDVNLLVQNDGCLYWCSDGPLELSFYLDRFQYKELQYTSACAPDDASKLISYSGGVTSIPHNLFLEVNGFSNLYWGWGGDDDDLFYRLWKKGYTATNPYQKKCSFTTMKYKNSVAKRNPKASPLIYHSVGRMEHDGLTSLRYKRLAIERKQLYVNITVDLGKLSPKMLNFMQKSSDSNCKTIEMPWE